MNATLLRHASVPAGIIAVLCLFCHCGSQSGSLAGGSGAGNPGGAVAVSMSAKIIASSTASSAPAKTAAPPSFDSSKLITTFDKGGLGVTIEYVVFSNLSMHFMLDSALVPVDLLNSMPHRPHQLSCGDNSIVVECPNSFDAVQGDVDTSLAGLSLPIARYTGVKLYFPVVPLSDDHQKSRDSVTQILISGSFPFEGEIHPFAVRIAYYEWPPQQFYRFSGGIFTLSATDTTYLELQFNAQKWFSTIDLRTGLESGSLSFDSTGALNITNRHDDPAAWAGTAISRDLLASGKLWVH